MFTTFFRVIRLGWQEITRNIGISFGTIFVLFIAISLVGGVILIKGMSDNLIVMLQKKVDISVYFEKDVKEKNIFAIKERVENFPEVKEVKYVSEDNALKNFKETYKDNKRMMNSLKEVGSNPLPASLNIRAVQASSYASLATFLEDGEYKKMIEKINYRQNEAIIQRLFSISDSIDSGGIVLGGLLVFIALVVTFNTIRLAIFSKKTEIETMKLIGATNWFVRGPFLVQGLLIGIFAGMLSFLLFYGIDNWISPGSLGIFGELGFLDFFDKNILLLLEVQLGGGILLGVIPSFIATQKHLNV